MFFTIHHLRSISIVCQKAHQCWLSKENASSCLTFQRFSRAGPRARGREWATLGVHPLSWLFSNNRLEKVPVVSVPHTSSNRLLLSNQDKGCTPSVAHSLPLPLGPTLLNLSSVLKCSSVVFAKQHFHLKVKWAIPHFTCFAFSQFLFTFHTYFYVNLINLCGDKLLSGRAQFQR